MTDDYKKRVVIITGGTTGIGLETARALSSAGYHVIITSRLQSRGDEAVAAIKKKKPSAIVDCMLLDLASLASVRLFADAFIV